MRSFFGWTRTPQAQSACSSLYAIPVSIIFWTILMCTTTTATIGPLTLPWGYTSNTDLWTSSCGNGSCASRSFMPGRLSGKNTLNGNSTGRTLVTIAGSVRRKSNGAQEKRTYENAPVIDAAFFAPCGMNCMVCYKHCYVKKPCAGCLPGDDGKPEHCRKCKIKDCIQEQGLTYCFKCVSFPCKFIENLEKSNNQHYSASLL